MLTEKQTSVDLAKLTGLLKTIMLPLIGLVLFIGLWNAMAKNIDTSLGQFPGTAAVWEQATVLVDEHYAQKNKATEFYERQQKRNAERVAKDPTYQPKIRAFTGAPTFFQQIWTSLYTVMVGFIMASLIAVPLGILCGLSKSSYAAINPLIQLFKPISPLAWLPLVTMVVSAAYVSDDPMFSKSFITSAATVALCCLWPTLINTAVGVSSIDKDLINVSKVLRLNPIQHVLKIVMPSSIPAIFTGLRLSLGIGWMVLIAAEMLAQNPGLGKFVWDEFQNGSSESLARIMVAVLTIGIIGFILDRLMLQLQKWVSWDKSATLR
ncbi:ABC transporter permease [Aliiglaciecola sp. 2_MG-2023]|uniref:ABC transporter permease n=2 Tax=Alteromonadales TaxID=135622 RepID=UPI00209111E1|nr:MULTISPECIES: ABC transporter permease [Aliiglaciecola]MDO6712448.1 ABC transporter permease [Aliiglaciecola sp. 2_MG-2023]MDO6753494.1 ABC transporter permease [Aliiglaciecola sp. 1_MG-2023]